ncbi:MULTISPECIES: NifU family protein [Saccharopolyspora]|uniref:NifU family protein n=1 Tax=Saccharopolyspora cebuensis TaxID=418759 RepID=A0ABV4CK25_9PSEU
MAERVDDAGVRERLARIDELLGQVEQAPGPAARIALDAVSALAEVYGEALARAVEQAGAAREPLLADELVGHLLVLHDLHPDPPERRVARALDALRPELAARGVEVALLGAADGVASVRLSGGGCGCSSAEAEEPVRAAVLAAAPELAEVRFDGAAEAAFVPLDALRPGAAG